MIWPPENVCMSAAGSKGPVFWRHRGGVVVGNPGRVCVFILTGLAGLWAYWPVSNRVGGYNTMAMAVGLYDPFQRFS